MSRKWKFIDEDFSPYELRLKQWIKWLEMQPQDKHFGEVLYLIHARDKATPLGPKIKNLLKLARQELNKREAQK